MGEPSGIVGVDMPPLETKDLLRAAVLWNFIGYDNDNKPLHAAPVQLTPPAGVRWTWKRTMITDAQNNTFWIDAQAVVAQKIDPDSLMWLGTLGDWYGTGSVDNLTLGTELCIIKDYREARDLKNRFTRYRVGLMKYQGLPNYLPANAGGGNYLGSMTQFIGSQTNFIGAQGN